MCDPCSHGSCPTSKANQTATERTAIEGRDLLFALSGLLLTVADAAADAICLVVARNLELPLTYYWCGRDMHLLPSYRVSHVCVKEMEILAHSMMMMMILGS